MNRLLLFVLIFIGSCSFQKSEKIILFEEKEVDKASLLIPSNASDEIMSPSEIKAVPDGFVVYDYDVHKLFKFDHEGNKLFSFGDAGRGPGEFQDIFGMWQLDDFFLVFDYTSAKFIKYNREGTVIDETFLGFKEFPDSPTKVEILESNQFIFPSRGKNGSLLTFVNMKTENIEYFGDAVDEYVVATSPEDNKQAIFSGRIPADERNSIFLSSNQTGIFSFQLTTGILEKYSYSGELIWEKHLNIPPTERLFDKIFEINRNRINRGFPASHNFSYAKGIDANEEGVAILLNTLEDQPLTVVWVSNNGDNIAVVTFHGVENQLHQTFTLSKDGSFIFFVNIMDGEVYRAEWSL